LCEKLGRQRHLRIGGLNLAVDHPKRTDKVILISPPGFPNCGMIQGKAQAERTNAVANPTTDVVRGVPGAVDIMAHVKILQKPEVRERNNIPEAN